MTAATDKDWVVPAHIPFERLKKRDLEECVYWLLDGMGARDLAWRKGGTGHGASDGGRDLEAKFYVSNDKGEVEPQLWWVECKGSKGTVDADEVKSALNNALATKDLVRIVVATNTQFSNPTRDWVERWQETHPSPRVALWDHVTLEKYLSEHPQVVLRLFSEALSRDGKLQAMQQRFWSKLEYVAPDLLEELWQQRHDGPMEGMALFAAICNEFAHGDISRRPWAGAIDAEVVLQVLMNGLENMTYLSIRAHAAGVDMHPIMRTIVYLLLIVLDRVSAKVATQLLEQAIYRGQKAEWPDYVREMLIQPIAVQLLTEMTDLCASDCRRIGGVPRQGLRKDQDERDSYWLRFERDRLKEEKRDRYVLIEVHEEPCKVGFKVDHKRSCPLVHFKPTINNVGDLLRIVKKVAAYRKKQAAAKRAAEARDNAKRAKKLSATKKRAASKVRSAPHAIEL